MTCHVYMLTDSTISVWNVPRWNVELSKGGLRWRCSGQNEEFTMYINGQ